jgi:arsenate reductase (thioredoxin)
MDKPRVLFLCTGNSARSQMAEAFLRSYAGDRFEVFSAGLEPKELHPLAIKVMKEKEISLEGQYSKSLMLYAGKIHFSYMITVCDNAEKKCPIFPGMGTRLHWPFEDPAACEGSDQEKLEKFREVRDVIEAKIKEWLVEVALH